MLGSGNWCVSFISDFYTLHKKWSLQLRISSVNQKSTETANFDTFTEEIFKWKLHFSCGDKLQYDHPPSLLYTDSIAFYPF